MQPCYILKQQHNQLEFSHTLHFSIANSVDLENSPLSSNPEKDMKTELLSIESKTRSAPSTKKTNKDKPTRVRTVLNEKQLSTLKRCYAANPRPDSVLKEQLVDLTGLSPRVIRVWFQNKRCKDKKKMMLNGGDNKMGVSHFENNCCKQ